MLQFTFQSQKISRIKNGCPSPFSVSHYYKPPFTTEILYAILFSCKGNMVNIDAFPGLINNFYDYRHLWSLQFHCVLSCNGSCKTFTTVRSLFVIFYLFYIFSGKLPQIPWNNSDLKFYFDQFMPYTWQKHIISET